MLAASVPISDTGTASIGITVAPSLQNRNTTMNTSAIAYRSVISTSMIETRTKRVVSYGMLHSRPGGMPSRARHALVDRVGDLERVGTRLREIRRNRRLALTQAGAVVSRAPSSTRAHRRAGDAAVRGRLDHDLLELLGLRETTLGRHGERESTLSSFGDCPMPARRELRVLLAHRLDHVAGCEPELASLSGCTRRESSIPGRRGDLGAGDTPDAAAARRRS